MRRWQIEIEAGHAWPFDPAALRDQAIADQHRHARRPGHLLDWPVCDRATCLPGSFICLPSRRARAWPFAVEEGIGRIRALTLLGGHGSRRRINVGMLRHVGVEVVERDAFRAGFRLLLTVGPAERLPGLLKRPESFVQNFLRCVRIQPGAPGVSFENIYSVMQIDLAEVPEPRSTCGALLEHSERIDLLSGSGHAARPFRSTTSSVTLIARSPKRRSATFSSALNSRMPSRWGAARRRITKSSCFSLAFGVGQLHALRTQDRASIRRGFWPRRSSVAAPFAGDDVHRDAERPKRMTLAVAAERAADRFKVGTVLQSEAQNDRAVAAQRADRASCLMASKSKSVWARRFGSRWRALMAPPPCAPTPRVSDQPTRASGMRW